MTYEIQGTMPLSDLVTIRSGGTPSKQTPEFWDGDIPWVSAKDMKTPFLSDAEDSVTSLGVDHGAKLAKQGDILVLARGMTLHQDVPICFAMRPLAFNQDVKGLTPNGVDGRFLFYALKASKPELLRRVDAAGHGTGRLNTEQLRTLPIPRFGQQAEAEIAEIFSALDDKIRMNSQTSDTLKEMARAIFRDWFIEFGPVRRKMAGVMDPVAVLGGASRDPEIARKYADIFPDTLGRDNLPVGWSTASLDTVATQIKQSVKPQQYPEKLYDLFSIPAFDRAAMPVREIGGAIKSNKQRVPQNSILFSRLNPQTPRVWWATTGNDVEAIASTEFFIAEPRMSGGTPWLYCLLCSEPFITAARSRVSGTSNSHQRINPQALKEVPCVQPQDAAVRAFSEMTRPFFDRINANKHQSARLAEMRDLLLPRLFRRQERVGEVANQFEDVA